MSVGIKRDYVETVKFVLWKKTKNQNSLDDFVEFAIQLANRKGEIIGAGEVYRGAQYVEVKLQGLKVDSARGMLVTPIFNEAVWATIEKSFIILEEKAKADKTTNASNWMPVEILLKEKVKTEGGVSIREKLKPKKVKSEGGIVMRGKLKSNMATSKQKQLNSKE